MKKCSKCKKIKAQKEFDTVTSKWCRHCQITHKHDMDAYREAIKLEVLQHYSNGKPQCFNCGYNKSTKPLLIRIESKKILGITLRDRGHGFHAWLRSNKFPKGYVVICANCAKIKGMR